MPEPDAKALFTTIPLRDLSPSALTELSKAMKLSLSADDMLAVQTHYRGLGREPTDVELEVIAQTWSEHCKHRIFGATVDHHLDGKPETVHSIFKTFIKDVSEQVMERKPGFVLSAFHDNAGFITLDENLSVCLKAETHNHPSALEPYAGANTGIGGVIRDILGAGKGAKPIASMDVFCFGRPDTPEDEVKGDTIHPLGILRGVVRGVRDYGNRMGIPTVTGAIHFDPAYTYNPLVYCGTAGVIPRKDISKATETGDLVVAVGGRTGRDGLHGATFSSVSLGADSHEEDKGAVQIGNPIEEKKVTDFILQAREEGLIHFVTDCGAGGFSSAAGEMLSETGGNVYLERCPLKVDRMTSWEIFLSESQERMVLAVDPAHIDRVLELAHIHDTEATVIGEVTDTRVLRVYHHGELVCELDSGFLHEAPVKKLTSRHETRKAPTHEIGSDKGLGDTLRALLADCNLCSREPVIREYDHEVQGNTVGKPLAGPGGDCPQDGSVLRIDGSEKALAIGLSLLPQYGDLDPAAMARVSVDEAFRNLVVCGADPDQVALLDNFCMGNPDDPAELGRLVETARGLAEAADGFNAPFVSGKDSFYNYFEIDGESITIPVTCLVSAMGVVESLSHRVGATLTRSDSRIALLGLTGNHTAGSAYADHLGADGAKVPDADPAAALARYRKVHQAIQHGWIRAAHDLSEGGLAVALAEFGFGGKAALEIDLAQVPEETPLASRTLLFSESGMRILFEIDPQHEANLADLFADEPWAVIGHSAPGPARLRVSRGNTLLLDESLTELKETWKTALQPYY